LTPKTPGGRSLVGVSERFQGFLPDLEAEAQARKEELDAKLHSLKEAITRSEKNLNSEIKRRQESIRALQSMFESQIQALTEKAELDLNERIQPLLEGTETSARRIAVLEKELKEEREQRVAESEEISTTLNKQLSALRTTFEMEKVSRLEREAQILKRVGDDIFRIQEKLDAERVAREAALTSLRDELDSSAHSRAKADEKFQIRMMEEINNLRNTMFTELKERENAENQIVATLDDVVLGLQGGFHIINKK